MPLLRTVLSLKTLPELVEFARACFSVPGSRHRPVVTRKETPDFGGKRLIFVLLRGARICRRCGGSRYNLGGQSWSTLRWAGNDIFENYQQRDGEGGIRAFF
ncbi:uncharacterized protein BO66DRAFT_395768 [Aspergillus aculeatinus CBS 121060]|uniref:Uncharacterized protein n=1 Tax=Aspergillus aculeatinus CBS 121060 TaxID=1448322 RepID=A0ACD1GUT5_9EURO|nr:hypothetical protein BO66DRAFT_395768 [Aspergillus aculeatinus CBS 121060]RAH65019.1 hypothetical protein BO66DRAFT_395768 [Aspergillus aculeatinus CBS 121060]